MAINVSTWSIRNPIPSILLFIMLTLVGLMSFHAMKIQNFPDIDLPTVTVGSTTYREVILDVREAGGQRVSLDELRIYVSNNPNLRVSFKEAVMKGLEPDVDFSAFQAEPDTEKVLPYQDHFPTRPSCSAPTSDAPCSCAPLSDAPCSAPASNAPCSCAWTFSGHSGVGSRPERRHTSRVATSGGRVNGRAGTSASAASMNACQIRPALAALMTIFLLSLGGLPPTAGFIAKWYVFSAAIAAGYAWLAILGVLTSVVAIFFYLCARMEAPASEKAALPAGEPVAAE